MALVEVGVYPFDYSHRRALAGVTKDPSVVLIAARQNVEEDVVVGTVVGIEATEQVIPCCWAGSACIDSSWVGECSIPWEILGDEARKLDVTQQSQDVEEPCAEVGLKEVRFGVWVADEMAVVESCYPRLGPVPVLDLVPVLVAAAAAAAGRRTGS